MKRLQQLSSKLSADSYVAIALILWWVVNMLQGGLTQLSDDEAYYHLFATNLDWGYYDHPPMIALLLHLGEWLFGVNEFGLRFFIVVLQPLYLWVFWRLIRPAAAQRQDGQLYIMICSAMLMLQLYGFIAVPDAPLMMTTVLFFWAYKRLLEGQRFSWVWLGVAMAAMAYSKYHGALIVIFTIMFNPRLLLNWRLYLSGALTLVLFTPHLLWQYNHDWASFAYHLAGRNTSFTWGHVVEFVLNNLVVFSLFLVPILVQGYRKVRAVTTFERTLKWMPIAFILFFGFSSIRGQVQPQWLIASIFGFVWVLFAYSREHERTRKYVVRMGVVTIILFSFLRLEMIFNPIGLRMELFGNHERYELIADVAQSRPVIFSGRYPQAAKYNFYTSQEAYCTPSIFYRTHHWQFIDDDKYAGKEVLLQQDMSVEQAQSKPEIYNVATSKSGEHFIYVVDSAYMPTKRLEVEVLSGLEHELKAGEMLSLELEMYNPYDYDVELNGGKNRFFVGYRRAEHPTLVAPIDTVMTIPAKSRMTIEVQSLAPEKLAVGEYEAGAVVMPQYMRAWYAGRSHKIAVVE